MNINSYSSSSTPSNSVHRSKKRKWTRQQLLRNLEIVGALSAPLPPTLPPSPPASRAASPALSFKRKSDATSYHEPSKRPRTGSFSQRPHHHHQPPHLAPPQLPPPNLRPTNPVPTFSRTEPCEDGEVQEEPVIASVSRPPPLESPAVTPSTVPIRRPKRGKPTIRYFDSLHDKYHNAGRMLKYSGDARFWSTYPASHREYRPLLDPPPPSSPYHKHGGLIARLELVDALVCFTYSIWNKDYSRRTCIRDTWRTIEGFLVWCKQKWAAEEGINDAEKAFVGLIWMIEAFIHGRKTTYAARGVLEEQIGGATKNSQSMIAAAAAKAEADEDPTASGSSLPLKSQPTPPMLPSPASIAPANSANSTPTTRDDGAPNPTFSSAPSSLVAPYGPGQYTVPEKLMPDRFRGTMIPAHVMTAMSDVKIPIGPTLIWQMKDQTSAITAAAYCMTNSQTTLTLPIMARFFPTTFARMVHSTLSPVEEHEPEFEDEEGELFWPGQAITGEGLGWVCLMGKAMINEFGKAYGYRGLDGVVPKPKPEEHLEDGSVAPPQGPHLPGSTPQATHNTSASATPQSIHGASSSQRPGSTPQPHYGFPTPQRPGSTLQSHHAPSNSMHR